MKIADMHCDTISKIYESKLNNTPCSLRKNNFHIDIEKLKKSNYILQNFAMFVDLSKVENPFEYCINMIDCLYQEVSENISLISIVKSYSNIEKNLKLNKISALISLEEGEICKGNISFLRILYKLGVRMMTLTWNYKNELAYPNSKIINNKQTPFIDTVNGLTKKGIEFLYEINKLGIILDVSHLSDAGFFDVAKYSSKPFVASHSNSRKICAHPRNLTDKMIKTISRCGGVIGINYYPQFLNSENGNNSYASYIVNHAHHIADTGGINSVSLGSDFDGISGNPEIKDASYMYILFDLLKKSGFKESEIDKIFYKNVLRVYKEVL
ncbi:dipeptidase [Clostridium sp. BJN0001]|uniref:dipeptidase n=1 Tax=Clostridium sp. BJN0001 TaxID=2930219 RepID=UPI001FD01BC0|nr:dipeptidase [Clostridium sp. BJN0001]